MILANVRIPEKVEGDLNAQLNANRAGIERLSNLFEEYGASVLNLAFDDILSVSETRCVT
ncbi:MAG: hypothetical protein CM1200mP41_12360 [Gammaproteobacteria bacterium]|nr:MAG: hypothetical protein CM1200mP41_12360 [Gammaproteobacteria bacterium]